MAEEQSAALGPEDYQQLFTMVRDQDAGVRAQALDLAKKLTPQEQQQFYEFQQKANTGKGEATRVDSSLAGMPPELAVAGALPIVRAVGSAVSGASGAGQGVIEGLKAAAKGASPIIKYEGTKSLLEWMHVPQPLAVATAMAVSGYKGKGAAGPSSGPAATPAPAGPLPRYSARDVVNIQNLMKQGATQQEAVDLVLKMRKSALGTFFGKGS